MPRGCSLREPTRGSRLRTRASRDERPLLRADAAARIPIRSIPASLVAEIDLAADARGKQKCS